MRNGPELKNDGHRKQPGGARAAASAPDDAPKFPSARGVLTAEEIEALLRPKQMQGALNEPVTEAQHIQPKVAPTFEHSSHEAAAAIDRKWRSLAGRLSIGFATGTGIKAAIEVSQTATLKRSQMTGLLQGKSSAIACIGPTEFDIRALVCFPPALADFVIAKACGAQETTGGRAGDDWTLSAIDCALLEQLLEPIGAAFETGSKLQAIETDVPYVSSLLASQQVDIIELNVQAPSLRSELAVIHVHAAEPERPIAQEARKSPGITALATARLASLAVPINRITALKAGSTLLLGLPPDQPVELLSGDRDGEPVFEGKIGRKGNKVALKITKKLKTFD